LKTSDGCGAPKKPRLPIFEKIYSKENYNAEIHDENYLKRSNSMSSTPTMFRSNSQDFSYQASPLPMPQQQPINYNYNYTSNYNMNNMGY
jgi:hypothetical protein